MEEHKKERLQELGAGALAEALLSLAKRNDDASEMVERMLASPEENIKRYRAKLSGIKRTRRFIRLGESAGLARRLEALLQYLMAGVNDPCSGAELAAAFFESDSGTLGRCDDSYGQVGDVYRFMAGDIFVSYASRCREKDRLIKIVVKLNRKDEYGVRDTLIKCASDYLDEPHIRKMIELLLKQAGKEANEYHERQLLSCIESLARQIRDASLFEQVRISNWGMSVASCIDIARVYLESGKVKTALSWMQKISKDETFQVEERDDLLFEIFEQLGDTEKMARVKWRIFNRNRSVRSLDELLEVIGQDKREQVISEQITNIQGCNSFSSGDAWFLIDAGNMDEAESYLVERAYQLDGYHYNSLLPIAKRMEEEGRNLAASLVYRALLESILDRAFYKGYPHAARYLRKLDNLASLIEAWLHLKDHNSYKEELLNKHGRKTSFLKRYEK